MTLSVFILLFFGELLLSLFYSLFITMVIRLTESKEEEPEFKWTAPQETEIPKPMDWKAPTDYQPGVYTLTFDHINFFETRDGIYRHYRIEPNPIEYPKPATPESVIGVQEESLTDAATEDEQEPVCWFDPRKHPMGLHSPSYSEEETTQDLDQYEWEEINIIGHEKPIRVRVR